MTEDFTFSAENIEKIRIILMQYPKGRQASAVLPLLDLAQRQNNGWLSQPALETVAQVLDMSAIRVHEIASFYTMFNLKPVGKYHLQVCRTTPCWLKGSDQILQKCKEFVSGCSNNMSTPLFLLMEVECLGACVNAPVVQINDDYIEDLNADSIDSVLKALQEGQSLADILQKKSKENPHA